METKEVNKSWEEQFSLRMAGKMEPDYLKKKQNVNLLSPSSLRKLVESKEIEKINDWENIAERKYREAEPILQILSSIETRLTCLDGITGNASVTTVNNQYTYYFMLLNICCMLYRNKKTENGKESAVPPKSKKVFIISSL